MAATNSDNISSSPAATLDGETVGERYSSERPLPAQAEKNEAVDHVLYSDVCGQHLGKNALPLTLI